MDFEIHSPDRPYIENAGYFDRNQIPKANQRTGPFWEWAGKLLGLPERPSVMVDRDDGAKPFITSLDGGGMIFGGRLSDEQRLGAMRRREQRIQELNNSVPYRSTLGEVVSEVVSTVAETVKSSKLTEARLFVGEKLRAGPMKATKLEKLAKSAGIAPRTLRRALKALKVQNRRNSDKTTTLSLIQAEPQAGPKVAGHW